VNFLQLGLVLVTGPTALLQCLTKHVLPVNLLQ
jgi:hypothetical protein